MNPTIPQNRLRGGTTEHLEHYVEFLRQPLVGLAGLPPEQLVERDGHMCCHDN
jgi:hypothetical protein